MAIDSQHLCWLHLIIPAPGQRPLVEANAFILPNNVPRDALAGESSRPRVSRWGRDARTLRCINGSTDETPGSISGECVYIWTSDSLCLPVGEVLALDDVVSDLQEGTGPQIAAAGWWMCAMR